MNQESFRRLRSKYSQLIPGYHETDALWWYKKHAARSGESIQNLEKYKILLESNQSPLAAAETQRASRATDRPNIPPETDESKTRRRSVRRSMRLRPSNVGSDMATGSTDKTVSFDQSANGYAEQKGPELNPGAVLEDKEQRQALLGKLERHREERKYKQSSFQGSIGGNNRVKTLLDVRMPDVVVESGRRRDKARRLASILTRQEGGDPSNYAEDPKEHVEVTSAESIEGPGEADTERKEPDFDHFDGKETSLTRDNSPPLKIDPNDFSYAVHNSDTLSKYWEPQEMDQTELSSMHGNRGADARKITVEEVKSCRYIRGYDPPYMTMPNDVNKFIFEGQDEEAIPNAGSDSEGVSCQQTSRGSAQEKDEGK